MTQKVDDILSQVVEETLSQLAFVFPEDFGYDEPNDALLEITGVVEFSGPFSGSLIMETSASILTEMTANMLGSNPSEASEDEKADALKEILNVICGNLLPKIGGTSAVFDIGPPRVTADAEPKGQEAGVAHLILEGGLCRAKLFIQGTLPDPS
jgi:CheY-specific phosphatase CheX